MHLQLKQRKFCSIHIQTLQEIGRFCTFQQSQILYISLTPKNLYLACWAISYISSIPTRIRYRKNAVNEVFYSRLRFKCSLLFRLFLHGLVHLTTTGRINSVTTSYCVKNLHISFVVSIKSTHEHEWYSVTCWNRLKELWKGLAEKYLWYRNI